jgi:hypothetical protein
MSTHNPHNGNGQRPWWWLLGALLVPLILASFGHLLQTTYSSAGRLSGLETLQETNQRRLERIEHKLDQLLERRP